MGEGREKREGEHEGRRAEGHKGLAGWGIALACREQDSADGTDGQSLRADYSMSSDSGRDSKRHYHCSGSIEMGWGGGVQRKCWWCRSQPAMVQALIRLLGSG